MARIRAATRSDRRTRLICRPGIIGSAPLWHPSNHPGAMLSGNLLIFLVGAAGFEPTTPSPPDWCANRAAPRPDQNGADYRTIRVLCFD